MKYIILILLSLQLTAQTTFITPMEYASQLYKNPRGIGCHRCHGENGEGRLVATYEYKKENREFRGPAINGVDFKEFYSALNKRKRGMPSYFLTKKEVQALYLYLNKENVDAK
ncbi:c-type cytochrome [Sulfurimonas sp.]